MAKVFKRVFIIIIAIVLLFYAVYFLATPVCSWIKVMGRYKIPYTFKSEKTEEEHFIEISNRAEEIVGRHVEEDENLTPEYVVEIVYNFKDQPQFFVVKFSGGKGVLGAIIEDEYYVLAIEKSDRDIFWENVGNTQIKKYYNGEKYCVINGEFLDANCRRRYDIKLSEEKVEKLKTQKKKIFVRSIETNEYYKKLSEITKFEKPQEDMFYSYVIPNYVANLTAIEHVQNITLRAQNKFNQLNSENKYSEINVELIRSFDYKLMYFLVTFVPKDGFEELTVYDFGIIIQDEYYFLREITHEDNKIFFEQWNVENLPKYYVIPRGYQEKSKETSCFDSQGVFVIKRDDKFYQILRHGVVFLHPDYIPRNTTHVMKVKNIYNPTVTDAFTVYQT